LKGEGYIFLAFQGTEFGLAESLVGVARAGSPTQRSKNDGYSILNKIKCYNNKNLTSQGCPKVRRCKRLYRQGLSLKYDQQLKKKNYIWQDLIHVFRGIGNILIIIPQLLSLLA
jgi:hypothetical protein